MSRGGCGIGYYSVVRMECRVEGRSVLKTAPDDVLSGVGPWGIDGRTGGQCPVEVCELG